MLKPEDESGGSSEEDEDDGKAAPEDRPEALIPRDKRAAALEVGAGLVAVAKQYGAPVGKSMATSRQ